MTTKYIKSGASDGDGLSWANARVKLSSMITLGVSAGDVIYLSHAHSETTAAAVSLNMGGSIASPIKYICGDDAAEPPTTAAATAVVGLTGAFNMKLYGNFHIHGVVFNCGSAAANFANLYINSGNSLALPYNQRYTSCGFNLIDTHPSSTINVGSSVAGDGCKTSLINCTFKLANVNQFINLTGLVRIDGGSMASGTSTPNTALFACGLVSQAADIRVENFDFSNLSASVKLIKGPPSSSACGRVVLRNCKLPASWSGSFVSATFTNPNFRAEMYNCDSGNTNYKMWIEDAYGKITEEVVIVKTGGASDGVTPISWNMTSNANANSAGGDLVSSDIVLFAATTGSAKTATVDIVHDSATALTDAEVWLEVEYLGSSSSTLGSHVDDGLATPLTTPANQASSSSSWITTGLTSPNYQKLSVTFTPQQKGLYVGRVHLAKASKTIYVDPLIVVS